MKTKYNQQKSIFLFVQHYSMLWLLLFCISTATIYAQSPQKLAYQSVVRDASGNLLTNTTVGIQISILQGSLIGISVYSETYSPTPETDINGLVSLEVGGGTPSGALFSSIVWANGSYFLKVDIDPLGGTSYTITGTSQLLSVPYALYAETSGGSSGTNDGWSLSGNAGTNSTNNFIGTTDDQELKFRVENEPFGELNKSLKSIFFGERAGLNNAGLSNIGMGNLTLTANTAGHDNVGIGDQVLLSNTTGGNNIAMGSWALLSNTIGLNNIGMGSQALKENTAGNNNIAMGSWALHENTGGRDNIAMGDHALSDNTTGDNNIAMGRYTFSNNTLGNYNTAIGFNAMASATTSLNNTAIGAGAMPHSTGTNNTAIGHGAEVEIPAASHQVRIGNDQITLATTQIAWTTSSDKKWKEDIRSLPYVLDFVSQLKPVDYIRKNNKTKTREIGFIAQDVEKLLAKFGYTDQGLLSKDSKGNLSLRYNDLIPVLTKAIQELSARIEKLEQRK